MLSMLCRAFHSASERSKYFSVTISRMGPTFCAMPPCTSTRLSWSFALVSGDAASPSNIRCWGIKRPRLMPNSGSPSPASTPSISFMPGQTPPESCQPPPDPPNHSPRSARASTRRRSCSCNWPVKAAAWPVARMQTLTSAANNVVETASLDPFGMLLTLLTTSRPRPGPTTRASNSARLCPEPSIPGGTMPDAITAALSRPR